MENKKVLLSIKDLHVKFKVRGRILTAIRGISLDFYENETVAIVGESGSGKSVFTKTFAGMLDDNGYIDEGSIIFSDEELADTKVATGNFEKKLVASAWEKLNKYSKLEYGAEVYREMEALKAEKKAKSSLSDEEEEQLDNEIKDLIAKRTDLYNLKQTVDTTKEHARYKAMTAEIADLDKQVKAVQQKKKQIIEEHKKAFQQDKEYFKNYEAKMAELSAKYDQLIQKEITPETEKRNEILPRRSTCPWAVTAW